jgi:hypothetical protein
MSWHIDGIGGGGGRIAVEFWKNTNIGLKGSWIIAGPNPDDPKEERIGDVERGNDPGYYIFTDLIADLKDTIKRERGQEGIDIGQYNKRMEVTISAFSIEEVRDKIAMGISTKVFKSDLVPEGDCESILFAFEFGGGLETKVLNIVSEELHKKTWAPIYALGALTDSGVEEEKGDDRVHFNTAWALRNLLVKKRDEGVDALFLVDMKAIEGEGEEKNRRIFECLLPMINPRKLDDGFTEAGLREKLTGGISMPQIFVPCYYDAENNDMDAHELLDNVVENKLMKCDHTKADSVIIFTSLLKIDEIEDIVNWVKWNIINKKISEERIHVCRVWNSTSREVLMLLRNPYGGGEEDVFYTRLSVILHNAIEYAKPKSGEERVNLQILNGFNKEVQDKLSDFINDNLIPDLEK